MALFSQMAQRQKMALSEMALVLVKECQNECHLAKRGHNFSILTRTRKKFEGTCGKSGARVEARVVESRMYQLY